MDYREIAKTVPKASVIGLGTWAFGSDRWWGKQDDKKSLETLERALELGVNLIDTAPIYGRGKSEEVIGSFLGVHDRREKFILATKLGLSWDERKIHHDLTPKRMRQELDLSRRRLNTDYFDLYQVHWPDPKVPIAETAKVMYEFYNEGAIKAVGVSNYSVAQMKEFMQYCPLHSLQPQYSMFCRDIEAEALPFCRENDIAVLAYAPLHSGLLTGKFFLDHKPVPSDINRQNKKHEFEEPRFSLNREFLTKLRNIAVRYDKTVAQMVLGWTAAQRGITCVLAGSRSPQQLMDNALGCGWDISAADMKIVGEYLAERDAKLAGL